MKTGRSQDSKAFKASGKSSLKTGSIGVKNPSKKTNKWDHKVRGCSEESLTDKENQHFLFKEPVGTSPGLPSEDVFLMKKREALEIKLDPENKLTSSAKIKLQLFPVNEETRKGLEKDGHNPYLELKLSGRKKISSVLKHIETKWGSSSTAKGEPMLFPYNRMEDLSDSKRWTINDSDITATAVYAAVGNPAVFRLKYGWFNIHEPMPLGIPSTPIPYGPSVQSGGTERIFNANIETLCDERDKVEATEKYNATDLGNAASEIMAQKMDNAASEIVAEKMVNAASEIMAQKMDNASADPLDNELRVSSSLQQPSDSWVDRVLDISIGGLLAEASLLGRFDSKLFGNSAATQTSHLISDSLDAFITSQISHPPVSKLPAEDLRTSILDAEETCHAFSLPKISYRADVATASGKGYSVAHSKDVSSNSLKLPHTDKVNDQHGLYPPSGKTQSDLLLSSQDERSLGLTGIKWNDSLGPFDLGMAAKKLFGGDSIGEFVK